jgi:hypothetical protein
LESTVSSCTPRLKNTGWANERVRIEPSVGAARNLIGLNRSHIPHASAFTTASVVKYDAPLVAALFKTQ